MISFTASCLVATAAEEAGETEEVSEVVPGAVVMYFVDVQPALEQRNHEHKRRDKALPYP